MTAMAMLIDPAVWSAVVVEEHQASMISTKVKTSLRDIWKATYPSGVHARRSNVAS